MTCLKVGTRLRSTVCTTEIMVIAAPTESVDLTCGGVEMVDLKEQPPEGGTLDANHSSGSLLGKRYVDDSGKLELLCTKPGPGSLAVNGTSLAIKAPKPLPASD